MLFQIGTIVVLLPLKDRESMISATLFDSVLAWIKFNLCAIQNSCCHDKFTFDHIEQ